MKKQKQKHIPKEPGLLRKLITIYFEQAKRRKALRCLQKQEWSFDFLALLLVKASQIANQNLSLTITDKVGVSYTLTYDKAKGNATVNDFDDSIFNHLDNDTAINDFIQKHSRR